jgi:hypothetical protein
MQGRPGITLPDDAVAILHSKGWPKKKKVLVSPKRVDQHPPFHRSLVVCSWNEQYLKKSYSFNQQLPDNSVDGTHSALFPGESSRNMEL